MDAHKAEQDLEHAVGFMAAYAVGCSGRVMAVVAATIGLWAVGGEPGVGEFLVVAIMLLEITVACTWLSLCLTGLTMAAAWVAEYESQQQVACPACGGRMEGEGDGQCCTGW